MKKKLLCSIMMVMLLAGCGSNEHVVEGPEPVIEQIDGESSNMISEEFKEETGEVAETNSTATESTAAESAEAVSAEAVSAESEQGTGYRTIVVSYDASQITAGQSDDPADYNTEDVYAPSIDYSGDGVEHVKSYDEGNMHYEEFKVTDFESAAYISLEPGGPNNNFDFHGVSIVITDEFGNVTDCSPDERLERYDTGLWHLIAYQQ